VDGATEHFRLGINILRSGMKASTHTKNCSITIRDQTGTLIPA